MSQRKFSISLALLAPPNNQGSGTLNLDEGASHVGHTTDALLRSKPLGLQLAHLCVKGGLIFLRWHANELLQLGQPRLYFGHTLSVLATTQVSQPKSQQSRVVTPTTHLHNFEHASISLTILTYAIFSKILDRFGRPNSKYDMTLALGVLAFWQEYILFHLHSTDHIGLEGHYHWFLQILILVSLITTVLGIPYLESFMISFVRSFSIVFQGVWYNVMGIMLRTKALMPKGYFMHLEEAHYVVRCNTEEALDRAKALTTLEFSWYLVICIVLTMCLYLYMIKVYPEMCWAFWVQPN
ncbi:uncharacterized protein LOC124922655 [Impatiens glandulifera]|uniref:uncharacterized protein LOC124922655 n=1 Tax=Impatiens glandulifera TaxID=253017 RepID=UPI001FB1337C|nr:uncharacterized protein LOC124922655 [Impatiens glandulifera]